MAQPTIVFTDELNISDAGQTTYTNLIRNIRTRLGNLSNRTSHNLPVLPNQKATPTDWFDITLRARDPNTAALRAIKLRIRVENLYLDGYQTENSIWYEFQSSNRLIPGSTFLPFDGSYTQLVPAAGTSLLSIQFGQQQAVNAINNLNNNTPTTAAARRIIAESLINMILLMCESVRFTDISDFFGAAFHSKDTVRLDHRKDVIIHNWGVLSAELLKMDADANYKFNFPEGNNIVPKIASYLDAVEVLGILLGDNARANVVVTLVNPTTTDVYGLIHTRYIDNLGIETKSHVLFHKESSKELRDVTPGAGDGQIIVLSESVLDDVPLNSSLIVKADLRDQDGRVIAQDHAEFPAQLSGTFQKQISGEHGEIHVKVTWI